VRAVYGADTGALASPPHHRAYANRAAWGSEQVHSTDFVLDPEGHGWHLDRARFDAALRDAARRVGADVRADTTARLAAPERDSGGWQVRLEPRRSAPGDRAVVTARVVVDATGRAAHVARALGARRHRVDRLVAAVGLLTAPRSAPEDLDRVTLVESVESGWWYTTALPGRRRVAAFLTDGDLLDPGALRRAAGWWARLDATTHIVARVRAHGYRLRGAPRMVAADTGWLDPVRGPGWLAAGDAALSLDPLSSLGILAAVDGGARAGAAAAAMAAGDPAPGLAYATHSGRQRDEYLAARSSVYATEARWPASPFWSRRRAAMAVAVGG
jgi:flavin-dependent dehydrogenase